MPYKHLIHPHKIIHNEKHHNWYKSSNPPDKQESPVRKQGNGALMPSYHRLRTSSKHVPHHSSKC